MFSNKLLFDYSISDGQNVTSNNARFVRFFWEVNSSRIGKNRKWRLYAKGGGFRKWYGNIVDIVDWSPEAILFYHKEPSARVLPEYLWYRKGITWGLITSSVPSFRLLPEQATFDKGGSSIFLKDDRDFEYILGLLNSKVFLETVSVLNSTVNFQVKDIRSMPVVFAHKEEISALVKECIDTSKDDWDSMECSWDFVEHPLLTFGRSPRRPGDTNTIEQAFDCWKELADRRFKKLWENEVKLNQLFANIYGLEKDLTPEVEEKDISIRRADMRRDVKSLISYAVGCMFGRFSLDAPGLVYAGEAWDVSKYKTFQPDKDGIIPICDDEYFEDDIVGRFVKFVEVVYGKDTLEENLRFIADALGGKGSSREIIRNYFINDFYADHLKVYQKHPIYWLFDSGKKNGFKCLIYMHRYQPDTIARIRTDYVHEQQSRYRTAIADLEQRINGASTSERVKLSKQMTKLQDQAEELRVYEEKIHHLADQMIKIDLDDGVKVNYAKFQDVLAKIK